MSEVERNSLIGTLMIILPFIEQVCNISGNRTHSCFIDKINIKIFPVQIFLKTKECLQINRFVLHSGKLNVWSFLYKRVFSMMTQYDCTNTELFLAGQSHQFHPEQ